MGQKCERLTKGMKPDSIRNGLLDKSMWGVTRKSNYEISWTNGSESHLMKLLSIKHLFL
jgi:hypothetical protein